MKYVKLNNSVQMPQLGLGTFQSTDPTQCMETILDATALGYRLIDTAQAYGNEVAIGKALDKCGVPRKELFIVTKVWFKNYENARESVLRSMKNLQVDYLDMVLLHWPFGNTYKAWRELEELNAECKVRSIGVSNYTPNLLVDLVQYNKVTPAVNQIETHLYAQQTDCRKWMDRLGIQHMGYSPFGQGCIDDMFKAQPVMALAEKYGKTPRQIALRYQLQMGVVLIPKTVSHEHLAENIDIFDFELSQAEMKTLAKMDKNQPLIGNSQDPGMVEASLSW